MYYQGFEGGKLYHFLSCQIFKRKIRFLFSAPIKYFCYATAVWLYIINKMGQLHIKQTYNF